VRQLTGAQHSEGLNQQGVDLSKGLAVSSAAGGAANNLSTAAVVAAANLAVSQVDPCVRAYLVMLVLLCEHARTQEKPDAGRP
jgi:hypothetical protein